MTKKTKKPKFVCTNCGKINVNPKIKDSLKENKQEIIELKEKLDKYFEVFKERQSKLNWFHYTLKFLFRLEIDYLIEDDFDMWLFNQNENKWENLYRYKWVHNNQYEYKCNNCKGTNYYHDR